MCNKINQCVKWFTIIPNFVMKINNFFLFLINFFNEKKFENLKFYKIEKINTVFIFILQNCHKLIKSEIQIKNILSKYI